MSAILLMMFFLHFVSTRHFSLHIKIIIIQEVYSTHCIYELFLNKLIVNRFRQNLWINYTVSLSVKWPSKKKKKAKKKELYLPLPCHKKRKYNKLLEFAAQYIRSRKLKVHSSPCYLKNGAFLGCSFLPSISSHCV